MGLFRLSSKNILHYALEATKSIFAGFPLRSYAAWGLMTLFLRQGPISKGPQLWTEPASLYQIWSLLLLATERKKIWRSCAAIYARLYYNRLAMLNAFLGIASGRFHRARKVFLSSSRKASLASLIL